MVTKASESIGMAESFLHRAWNKLEEARNHLKQWHFPETISSCQECIELSIKAIFLLLGEKYPKKHDFSEEEFEEVLRKIPSELKHLEIPKLYLYSKFWLQFYTVAKYGLERMAVGPEKLFGKEEAELAIKHAEKCRSAASQLFTYVRRMQTRSKT